MIRLSVVVATRNNGSWLRQCLDSLVEQTVQDLEIVIVDDASDDDSRAVIREYSDRFPKKIHAVYLSNRVGVARARDRGFREAEGEFVSTLDGDDYLCHPRKLETELELVLAFARQGRQVAAFSGIQRVNADGRPIPQPPPGMPLAEGRITRELLERSCRIPRDFTFRRDLYFQAGGYDFHFPIYEDWDLKLRLSPLLEFLFTGMDGVAYRRHGGGLSAAPLNEHLRWLHKGFRKNRHLVSPSLREESAAAFNRKLVEMRRRYLAQYVQGQGHTWTAFRYIFRLGFRGESIPGWRKLARRVTHRCGKKGMIS